MASARCVHHTYDEYLAVEAQGELRHEYLEGEIYAMAGGTPEHAALAARVLLLLAGRLPGCTPLTSDLRVRIEATGLTTYPDATLVCGPVQRAALDRTAITNPSVLVEVTSPSTEAYDRQAKLAHYQQLPSLRAVLIVAHDAPRLTLVERAADGWQTAEAGPGGRVVLASLATVVELGVDEVYAALGALG